MIRADRDGADAAPHDGDGHGRALIRPLRQSTEGTAPHRQFDLWRDQNDGLVDYVVPAEPPRHYPVRASTWRFGRLALMAAETPAGVYRRTDAQLRRDGVDVWSFTIAVHGRRLYRTRDQVAVMQPGQLFLHSLAQPFTAARTGSGWLHLYLPRDELPEPVELARAGGVLRLDTPGGRLLHDHLVLLAAELPRMTVAEAERMAEATRALVALALSPTPVQQAHVPPPVQLGQVRRLVRTHLSSAILDPVRLSQMAGMSRSQLYRVLEPHGGVAHFIQAERLQAAHRALSDREDARSIMDIAESVGLFDASSFSRMFRRAFGCTPRDLRMAHAAGTVPHMAAPPSAAAESASLGRLLLGM
jgi:AraC-like DNA-binding protein